MKQGLQQKVVVWFRDPDATRRRGIPPECPLVSFVKSGVQKPLFGRMKIEGTVGMEVELTGLLRDTGGRVL